MDIHIANSAGFCFGVKRAVQMALESVKTQNGPVYMLGDIVHNEHVIRELNQAGIQVIDSLEHVNSGTLLIRAHGAVPEVSERARKKGLTIIDATCSLVLEIHRIARQLQEEGYRVVVIGDHDHDEVIGIAGQVQAPIIVSSPEEVDQVIDHLPRIGVVVQSTQNIENVQQIICKLSGKCRELRFINTICYTTKNHQRDIRELPIKNDIMIIIGSFTSANTCRLAEISRKLNPRTYQVESAADVKVEWFHGINSVGVSAGASTPNGIMQEVIEKIREMTTQW